MTTVPTSVGLSSIRASVERATFDGVRGNYREPIVESEAQELARDRELYARRRGLQRAVRLGVAYAFALFLGALVAAVVTGAAPAAGVGALVFVASVIALRVFVRFAHLNCPRCGGPLVPPARHDPGCAICGAPPKPKT
jgi:hypothetical protein